MRHLMHSLTSMNTSLTELVFAYYLKYQRMCKKHTQSSALFCIEYNTILVLMDLHNGDYLSSEVLFNAPPLRLHKQHPWYRTDTHKQKQSYKKKKKASKIVSRP